MKIDHIKYSNLLVSNDQGDMLSLLKKLILGINVDISYCNIDRIIKIFLSKAEIYDLNIEHNFKDSIPQRYVFLSSGVKKKISASFTIFDAINVVINLYSSDNPEVEYRFYIKKGMYTLRIWRK